MFCECRAGYTFAPETYTCAADPTEDFLLDPSSLGGLAMLPFLKNYKKLLLQSGGEPPNDNRKMDGGIVRRPAVQWTRGIFVNPRSGGPEKSSKRKPYNNEEESEEEVELMPRASPLRAPNPLPAGNRRRRNNTDRMEWIRRYQARRVQHQLARRARSRRQQLRKVPD